jgi:hypothetical protein
MSPYHNGEKLVSAMTLHLSPNETMELELKQKEKIFLFNNLNTMEMPIIIAVS